MLLEELEALAIEAAVAAGRLIVGERPDVVAVAATKTSPTDVVTAMDTAAEDFLREVLRRERPHDALLGEERAISAGESGLTWVLDPIDGTVNYLYGIPQFGVSVAVVTGDPTTVGAWRPVAGAVAHPSASTVYHARAGAGAWRRGPDGRDERLTVSTASSLDAALVGTGFGYRADQRRAQAEILARSLKPLAELPAAFVGRGARPAREGRDDVRGVDEAQSARSGVLAQNDRLRRSGEQHRLRGHRENDGNRLRRTP